VNKWRLLAVMLGLAAIVALPVTRDEIHWQFSRLIDSAAEYRKYLGSWPAGRHASEARSRHDERDWIQARMLDTIEALTAYSREHADGAYTS